MKLEDAIQEIKRRVDLAQVIGQTVKLTKKGSSYLGLCPFHGEKTPSFNVRPDKGYFKCFGCGVSGDVFSFLEKQTGQLFMDIVKRLASEHGIEIDSSYRPRVESPDLSESLNTQQSYFQSQLVGAPLNYLLNQRKYSQEMIQKMGLGFGGAQSGLFQGRITIPIHNHRGDLVGFGGRIFGEAQQHKPKYVNSAASERYEKSHILYGLYASLPLIKKQNRVVLVEGYFDVMALLGVEIPAVAPCGTSLTEFHVSLLKKYTDSVILCFDQDDAGKKAHEKALLLFLSHGFQVQAVSLAEKDPDTLWQQGRKQELVQLFSNPLNAVELRIQQASREGVGKVQNRIQALENLLPFLAASKDPLVNRQYVRLAAQILQEDELLLVKAVLKHRPDSVARVTPVWTAEPNVEVVWSDAEKELLQAVISHPELLQGREEILRAPLNPELKVLIQGLLEGHHLFEIPVPRNAGVIKHLMRFSGQMTQMNLENAEKIGDAWILQVQSGRKQVWLQEQQQKLQSAAYQGNLEEVRQALKNQSGVLKKGWG